MKKGKILLTAHPDNLSLFPENSGIEQEALLNLPLESYQYNLDEEVHEIVERELDQFAYIIYGNMLSAMYFMRWAQEYGQLERVQKLVNLVLDPSTANYLESHNIPAVMPHEYAKPIDVMEFLLRISYEGKILYPSNDQKSDEIPGLLTELDLPFIEFQVYSGKTIKKSELISYRKTLNETNLLGVIFHNESSILRTQTAFPELDLHSVEVISAGSRVTHRLAKLGIKSIDAKGSRQKMAEIVSKLVEKHAEEQSRRDTE